MQFEFEHDDKQFIVYLDENRILVDAIWQCNKRRASFKETAFAVDTVARQYLLQKSGEKGGD
jgi:hypothetical protein